MSVIVHYDNHAILLLCLGFEFSLDKKFEIIEGPASAHSNLERIEY